MTRWFQKHAGWATVVLVAVAFLTVAALYAAGTGHVLAGAGLFLVALTLWQPIQSTIGSGYLRR